MPISSANGENKVGSQELERQAVLSEKLTALFDAIVTGDDPERKLAEVRADMSYQVGRALEPGSADRTNLDISDGEPNGKTVAPFPLRIQHVLESIGRWTAVVVDQKVAGSPEERQSQTKLIEAAQRDLALYATLTNFMTQVMGWNPEHVTQFMTGTSGPRKAKIQEAVQDIIACLKTPDMTIMSPDPQVTWKKLTTDEMAYPKQAVDDVVRQYTVG
ncbi:MAG: hypothetical protein ABIJ03_03180 [Patescibacteria group bacterium]